MMFGGRGSWRETVEHTAQRFREKGATSPDRALTAQELGLPPRFELAMKRRLGASGIFVDVGGRYYLNEDRLRELEQRQQTAEAAFRGARSRRSNMFAIRIARMALGVVIICLVLVNWFLGRSLELWVVIAGLAIVWVAVTILQIYYLASSRRGSFMR